MNCQWNSSPRVMICAWLRLKRSFSFVGLSMSTLREAKPQETQRAIDSNKGAPRERTDKMLEKLTLAAPRHLDGDCKGTVTGSYRSNLDWVWLGGTGSVQSIRAFHALVSPALMGAERILRSFLWGGVYFSAGEVLRTAVEKLALLIYVSTTAIEVNISKSASMLFE